MPATQAQPKTKFIRFRVAPIAWQKAQAEAQRLGLSVDELAQVRFLARLADLSEQATDAAPVANAA